MGSRVQAPTSQPHEVRTDVTINGVEPVLVITKSHVHFPYWGKIPKSWDVLSKVKLVANKGDVNDSQNPIMVMVVEYFFMKTGKNVAMTKTIPKGWSIHDLICIEATTLVRS